MIYAFNSSAGTLSAICLPDLIRGPGYDCPLKSIHPKNSQFSEIFLEYFHADYHLIVDMGKR